ncbi:protein phosphatase 1 regulatory subunit 3C-B [Synchiropus splendidus]|uniref:protein phosphatase 1 regulatory subunit 3C-B n=1 Tax=Synchiropus splendidus TaxID=270530 RepID=UPI00237EA9C1|nr:protein phosphatase 1 regulatory subunit 3C-B [Synchiropus splendidus]
MSCTRILHALGTYPQPAVAPHFAMSLSRQRPIQQLITKTPPKQSVRQYQPMDRLLATSVQSANQRLPTPPPSPSKLRSCFRRNSSGANKKRVVFADAKGLALTAVRLFFPETTNPISTLLPQPSTVKIPRTTENTQQKHKLRLGFPPPTADISSFLARLREACVQLESCSVSEHLLSGRVRVCHVSAEKTVNLKVTFDSWRSHHDVQCTFLQREGCGVAEMDVFTFDLGLPQDIDPNEQIEFFVVFRPGPEGPVHWDNNRGQNYSLHVDNIASSGNQYSTLSKQSASFHPHFSADLLRLPRHFSSRVEGLYASKYSI